MNRTTLTAVALGLALIGVTERPASAQLMTKPQVANLIKNVENGVDEFRNYLEKRAENTNNAASAAQTQGKSSKRKATDSQKANASAKKDALDDALGDLNREGQRQRQEGCARRRSRRLEPIDEPVAAEVRPDRQMDGDERPGREGGRRWAKDQSGGGARQLRTRCRQAVGRAPNGHQRSGACVWRTADGDLTDQRGSIRDVLSRHPDSQTSIIV